MRFLPILPFVSFLLHRRPSLSTLIYSFREELAKVTDNHDEIIESLQQKGLPIATLEKLTSLGQASVQTLLKDFHIQQEDIILQALFPVNATKRPLYKDLVVNQAAKERTKDEYGLPKDFEAMHPHLYQQYQDWNTHMTLPNPYGEEPIRAPTANTYLRHFRLFFGWYARTYNVKGTLTMETVLPDSSRESVKPILDFLLFLSNERQTSHSYQANILRGLVKLAKYRFRDEEDLDKLPILMELRKQHRHANQQPAMRSSNEDHKWMTWPDFLKVVQKAKTLVLQSKATDKHRQTATLYQKYLVLAIFAQVPDRQRTIRELVIGKSLVKKDGIWCIQHRPQDYKTGKTYGVRPLLKLAQLTNEIDDFIDNWRPHLNPKTQHLFCQVRTSQPLTQDSVYQIVARTCYEHSGKRTNPHLLRDMIVTHVRGNNQATEAQLEALALYMGHSISVQRASYDRRTLAQKVEPAVDLLQSVNNLDSN